MKTMSDSQMRAWRLLLEAHAVTTQILSEELAAERDLPLVWYDVLVQLHEAGGRMRMHELADSLLLSRSATTRFVDRLETEGLIERMVCEEDRRGTFVGLTQHGHQRLREAAPVHLRGIDEHFGRHLTRSEADALASALAKVVRAEQH